jgi:hypothetical protein
VNVASCDALVVPLHLEGVADIQLFCCQGHQISIDFVYLDIFSIFVSRCLKKLEMKYELLYSTVYWVYVSIIRSSLIWKSISPLFSHQVATGRVGTKRPKQLLHLVRTFRIVCDPRLAVVRISLHQAECLLVVTFKYFDF